MKGPTITWEGLQDQRELHTMMEHLMEVVHFEGSWCCIAEITPKNGRNRLLVGQYPSLDNWYYTSFINARYKNSKFQMLRYYDLWRHMVVYISVCFFCLYFHTPLFSGKLDACRDAGFQEDFDRSCQRHCIPDVSLPLPHISPSGGTK